MAKEKELSVEALAIAGEFLFEDFERTYVDGHQLRIIPIDGGGSALIRAIDDTRRGVVLKVEDVRLMSKLPGSYFEDLVDDQAFTGTAKEIGAEIADTIYVAARAGQLLGRHS